MAHKAVGEDATIKRNPFKKLKEAEFMSENDLNATFVEVINKSALAPALRLAFCGDKPNSLKVDDDGQKVDSAFYRFQDAPGDGRQRWSDQLIPVEFKSAKGNAIQDPYEDTADGVRPATSEHRTKNRGQIITYAESLFAIQHRLAVFTLLVIGRKARFIRWDRSGSIVTNKFDYYLQWKFFVDVLWRVANCCNVLLGFDPTAHLLSLGDPYYELMTTAAVEQDSDIHHTERFLALDEVPKLPLVFAYVRKAFRESLEDWPRYRVEPRFRAKGLAGRGTRGYVALDCETQRFVWLKDAWRAHYLLVDREGDILERLKKAQVARVPTVVCHGDIGDQVTLTPQWWEQKNSYPTPSPSTCADNVGGPSSSTSTKRKLDEADEEAVPPPKGLSELPFRTECPLRCHKHYRLVEEEVALPLSEFQNGKQLIYVVRDCVLAHQQAYKKAKLLHRDISSGNILIYPRIMRVQDQFGAQRLQMTFTGLLADWEMAKPIDTEGPRQPERTGTWQYMSVALLSRTRTLVEICDELESFFYVILYHAVRYLKSNFIGTTVADYIDEFFDQYGFFNDEYVCGQLKLNTIEQGRLVFQGSSLHFDAPAVNTFLTRLLSWFKARRFVLQYDSGGTESVIASLPPAPRPPTPPSPCSSALHPSVALEFECQGDVEEDAPTTRIDIPELESKSAPTPLERKLASMVLTHEPMLQDLKDAIERLSWANSEKLGDRVPPTWRPDQRIKLSVVVGGSSSKKLKLDEATQSEPALIVPSHPPKTPRKGLPLPRRTRR
ncbi:hypothetical protein C8T65DRAFT_781158 [Cerioporus squamosus]|nr:hypothetical protein C8T65DRAFT_781158 [Cerioporus squamosus]